MKKRSALRRKSVAGPSRPRYDPEIRFAKFTCEGAPPEYRPELGPCLVWQGSDNGNGYGTFCWNGKGGYAHRYAWERNHGPIPTGLTVDHLCRVRRCVNVNHMELVDGPTNTRRGIDARTSCMNGHPRQAGTRGNCRVCQRIQHRKQADKRRRPPGVDDRVHYDQWVVREQIALIRMGLVTINSAARVIGCNGNYLGRRTWHETKAAVLERDCHICLRCGDGAVDVHHRQARGSGGGANTARSFGMDNLVSVCRSCHDWVEGHPAESIEKGWKVLREMDPRTVRLWLPRRGPVLLTRDGSVTYNPGTARGAVAGSDRQANA